MRLLKLAITLVALLLPTTAGWAVTAEGPAANFTLKSTSGENIRLSEHLGDVVLINFWASWCGPCRQEMPHLDALQSKYAGLGFTVLGINVEQDPEAALSMLRQIPVNFPVLLDTDSNVSELYNVDAMPATVLVDREGVIRFMHRGYKPGYELHYEEQLKQLVRE